MVKDYTFLIGINLERSISDWPPKGHFAGGRSKILAQIGTGLYYLRKRQIIRDDKKYMERKKYMKKM